MKVKMEPEKIGIDVGLIGDFPCPKIETLILWVVAANPSGQVVFNYGGKQLPMVATSILEEVCLAARDVVRTHTAGVDAVQDAFVARLAALIGEDHA